MPDFDHSTSDAVPLPDDARVQQPTLAELLKAATGTSTTEKVQPAPLPRAIEQDREVLAWLQRSPTLGDQVTGYICDALLDWCLQGRPWPEEPAPSAGPPGDHLQLLKDVIGRLRQQIPRTDGVAGRLELGRVARLLDRAVHAVDDPQGVRDAIGRELLMMPAITGQRLLPPDGLNLRNAPAAAAPEAP